jgi:VWFA-related protein
MPSPTRACRISRSLFIFTVLAFTVLAEAALAQSPPETTFRVPVRLVTASTLVFSKDGRLIPNLNVADFRVLDNGLPQKPVLDTEPAPVSVAVVMQTNQDVRSYLPFLSKTGSVIDALLVGATGEVALIGYGDDVTVLKPFESGDLHTALRTISANGQQARAIDAASKAIGLLSGRPATRSRILLLVGQAADTASETTLPFLKEQVQRENVTVFALTLPQLGRAFVTDTFSIEGQPGGGFKANLDFGRLIAVLDRSGKAASAADPFSAMTAATGGTQLHVRNQKDFENAIGEVGVQLRSAYLLRYSPTPARAGYHAIQVEVSVPEAKVYTKPGYWLSEN